MTVKEKIHRKLLCFWYTMPATFAVLLVAAGLTLTPSPFLGLVIVSLWFIAVSIFSRYLLCTTLCPSCRRRLLRVLNAASFSKPSPIDFCPFCGTNLNVGAEQSDAQ